MDKRTELRLDRNLRVNPGGGGSLSPGNDWKPAEDAKADWSTELRERKKRPPTPPPPDESYRRPPTINAWF